MKKLLTLLNTEPNETEVRLFLKSYPDIVLSSFTPMGGHSEYVLTEFPLGIHYRADFVIPYSFSGEWVVHFIELEPVNDPIFTRAGVPSKRFNSAISQINDWAEYIKKNRNQIKQDLADWCIKHDLLGTYDDGEPCNFTGNFLRNPNSFTTFKYHIVIGRRNRVNEECRRKMNQYQDFTNINIRTYDRFVDIENKL